MWRSLVQYKHKTIPYILGSNKWISSKLSRILSYIATCKASKQSIFSYECKYQLLVLLTMIKGCLTVLFVMASPITAGPKASHSLLNVEEKNNGICTGENHATSYSPQACDSRSGDIMNQRHKQLWDTPHLYHQLCFLKGVCLKSQYTYGVFGRLRVKLPRQCIPQDENPRILIRR